MKKIVKFICTLGGIGYLPAPGTCGSLVAIPFVFFFAQYASKQAWTILVPGCIYLLIFVIGMYIKDRQDSDPQEIVIDEFFGMLVALGSGHNSVPDIVLIFCLFRFFDIVKPWPISALEKIPGAAGILLDDLFAGAFARSVFTILVYYGIW